MKLPEFNAEYLQARAKPYSKPTPAFRQHSAAALRCCWKLMADPSTPASVRARAALSIMEHANRSLHTDDLEVRIARLEALPEHKE